MAERFTLLLLALLHGPCTARGAAFDGVILDPAPPPITLEAADGIVLKIEFPQSGTSALDYSVSLDGEVWLKSGPVAMTSGGVTYTSECTEKDTCLSFSGPPTKSSGTDVSIHSYHHACAGRSSCDLGCGHTGHSFTVARTVLFTALTDWSGGAADTRGIHRSHCQLEVQWGRNADRVPRLFCQINAVRQSTALVLCALLQHACTLYRSLTTTGLSGFEQIFPSAITGAASQHAAVSVSTAFPSWLMDDTAGLHGFAGQGQGATNGPWASTDFYGGTKGGIPLVLYKKTVGSDRGLRSVVTSPLNNFMAATIASPEPHLFGNSSGKISAAGLFASVTEIPAGYTHPTVLVGAHGGPTPALMAWGDILLASTGKTRTNYANHPTDVSLTHIGYWTGEMRTMWADTVCS